MKIIIYYIIIFVVDEIGHDLFITLFRKNMVDENILKLNMKDHSLKGRFENGEIGLPMSQSNLILPCGIYARWEKE